MPRLTLSIRREVDSWVISANDTGDSSVVFHGHYESLKFGLERLSAWLKRITEEQANAS